MGRRKISDPGLRKVPISFSLNEREARIVQAYAEYCDTTISDILRMGIETIQAKNPELLDKLPSAILNDCITLSNEEIRVHQVRISSLQSIIDGNHEKSFVINNQAKSKAKAILETLSPVIDQAKRRVPWKDRRGEFIDWWQDLAAQASIVCGVPVDETDLYQHIKALERD